MNGEGRVAVVTGAGSGIGRRMARALGDGGWRVALAGRREQPLHETLSQLPDGIAVSTDVTAPDSVQALFARVRQELGRVDLLFNSAGVFGSSAPIDELDFDSWREVVATNLDGAFLCAREAFRAMKEQRPQGGRIINNGSVAAQAPRPFTAAYAASKHGLTGLTKTLSLEGRRYDIACSQIDLGNAATNVTEAMTRGVPQADGSVAPEPRLDLQHVADAILYMAGLPLDANVQFMTVMATKMPLVGRG